MPSDGNVDRSVIKGETGTGKTTFLSLLANILKGNSPNTYETFNEVANEAGGSGKYSQTNNALLYSFESEDGVTFRILDTPGLADTRGIAQDEQHKENIANTIKNSITTVDAILILANGTVPRLGFATDYALSTLTSMFPITLAKNIGFLFTNVPSPLSWNFDEDSLPEALRGNPFYLLDNPIALQSKYLRENKRTEDKKKFNQNRQKMLKLSVEEGHTKALGELIKFFDWLDTLSPQPTIDILLLHDQSRSIEDKISDVLVIMKQIRTIQQTLRDIERDIEHTNLVRATSYTLFSIFTIHHQTIEQNKSFQSTITQKVHKQVETTHHNTLCAQPGCYSNCDENCSLSFSFDPRGLLACWVFNGLGRPHSDPKCHPINLFTHRHIPAWPWPVLAGLERLQPCAKCGHSYDQHHHYNSRWELHEVTQVNIDTAAKWKYDDAISEKARQELAMMQLKDALVTLERALAEATADAGRLLGDYDRLSLSGGFVCQVRKSVALLELTLETMCGNGTDAQAVKSVEKALVRMQEKLAIVELAKEQSQATPNLGRRFISTIAGY